MQIPFSSDLAVSRGTGLPQIGQGKFEMRAGVFGESSREAHERNGRIMLASCTESLCATAFLAGAELFGEREKCLLPTGYPLKEILQSAKCAKFCHLWFAPLP